ncbi:MAG: hypothetical protein H6559_14160 [Lewinellaceae bacterium]|nr:hypothetical protein [Lewinellaceae bacterium]
MIPEDDKLDIHKGASPELSRYAKQMQHEPAEAEAILREALSNRFSNEEVISGLQQVLETIKLDSEKQTIL